MPVFLRLAMKAFFMLIRTDHSLFGFDDACGILTIKLMVGSLKNVVAVICVSHTGCIYAAKTHVRRDYLTEHL